MKLAVMVLLLFIQSSVQSFESDQIAELYIALIVCVCGLEVMVYGVIYCILVIVQCMWVAAHYQLYRTSPVASISPTPFQFRNGRQYNIKQLEWGDEAMGLYVKAQCTLSAQSTNTTTIMMLLQHQ